MPINQYDNPARYEYKSLGLEKLAGPMAALQHKFDITQATLDDAEFKLEHTPWGTDPERAKAIISEFESKRDKIAEDLMGTKNFRKATQQLKSLNKEWTKNPEAIGLSTQYANFKKIDEEERQRFLKGTTSDIAYQGYRNKAIEDYKAQNGYSYSVDDSGVESYNTLNRQNAIKDMSKEYDDMKIELAKMNKAEIKNTLTSGGIDGTTHSKIFIETMVEELKSGVVSSKTEAALKSMTRFKPWLDQRIELDYLQKYDPRTNAGKANGESLINNTIAAINTRMSQFEKADKEHPDKKYL